MTINTVSQFLFKVFVTAGLVVTLTACGGGGGSTGNDQSTPSSQAVVSAASSLVPSSASSVASSTASSVVISSATSTVASSVSSSTSSLTSNSSVSSVASSSTIPFLMGGAIQGASLNIATVVSTLAGTDPGIVGADGIGTAGRFNQPNAVVRDGNNLYVADTYNHTIRKIVISTGAVTTLAGTAGTYGSVDGTGAAARFQYPTGITTDGTNLYVADTYNHTIRKIVISTGAVTTLAGTALVMGHADGIGAAATFNNLTGITTDGTNLYVTDVYTIRKIVIATGAVTTFAGSPAGVSGWADGTGWAASFNHPNGITTDGTNLYVADSNNHTIRKISIATGAVTTLTGLAPISGNADGTGAAARFSYPFGITTDGTNLYVTDTSNYTIRKIVIATGAVTTFAGSGVYGSADGTSAAARFSSPKGIATDGTNFYVTDSINNTIRKIVVATGAVTTFAGTVSSGSTDGTGSAANFDHPVSVTTDGSNLYVADTFNSIIRKVAISTGAVNTLAGTAGKFGSADGTGAAANFAGPQGITTDGTNLYVTDQGSLIRKIVIATGAVTTLAGAVTVNSGSADGIGAAASFDGLTGITTDGTNLYVADTWNYTIRKIVISTGVVTTLAGTAKVSGSVDGTGAAARFYNPEGVATDGTNLYVADGGNYTIRKIVIATGAVTTLAGTAGVSGSTDGVGAAARFGFLFGITTDGTNLYATDFENNTIRKIVIATGEVTTLAGMTGVAGSADGVGAAASFDGPDGITTDGFDLFVTDALNNTIRKIH